MPYEVTTPEMVKKIHKMVLDDRRLKVRELADTIGVSKSAVHRILTENLRHEKAVRKMGAAFSHSRTKTAS